MNFSLLLLLTLSLSLLPSLLSSNITINWFFGCGPVTTYTINTGDTVTWINTDGGNHNVASQPVGTTITNQPDTAYFATQNGQRNFTFNEVGSFNYGCQTHPNMFGLIDIVAPSSTSSSSTGGSSSSSSSNVSASSSSSSSLVSSSLSSSLIVTPSSSSSSSTSAPSGPISAAIVQWVLPSQSTVTIRPGQTVTWIWADTAPHTVNATSSNWVAQPPSTVYFAPFSYSYTFNTTGVFVADCAVHGTSMLTTINVVRSSAMGMVSNSISIVGMVIISLLSVVLGREVSQ